MGRKITISVSDELAAQLEPYKEKMNLSRMFADAVERELGTIKATAKIQDMIARHKSEAMDETREGYIAGLELVKDIGFRELDQLFSLIEKLQRDPDWVAKQTVGGEGHPTDKLPGMAVYKFRVAKLPEIPMRVAAAAWDDALSQLLGGRDSTPERRQLVARFKEGSSMYRIGFLMAIDQVYNEAVFQIQYKGPRR